MKILEILTNDGSDGSFKEWLVIYKREDCVSFDAEYEDRKGTRKTWNDAGIIIKYENLPAALEALEEVLKDL